MGSYRITPLPGTGSQDGRRLLGVSSLQQAAFLSRACVADDPTRTALESLTRPPGTPLVAGLVEVGEADGFVWVVEAAGPCVPLSVVLAAGRKAGKPLPPNDAAWLALRLCQACVELGEPHLRLSPRNVFLQPRGEPFVLGAGWARLLPPEPEDVPFVPGGDVLDPRADAFAAARLALSLAATRTENFPQAIRLALESAGAASAMLSATPAQLARALARALGEEAVAHGALAIQAHLRSLALPRPGMPTPASPTLQLKCRAAVETALDDEPTFDGGPSLSADGRIELAEPAPAPEELAAPLASEELELAIDPPSAPPASAPVFDESPTLTEAVPRVVPAGKVDFEPKPAPALEPEPDDLLALVVEKLRSKQVRLGLGIGLAVFLLLIGLWLRPLIFPPTSPLLSVNSDPRGATVRIGDRVLGETPFISDGEVDLPREDFEVRVEKEGFAPALRLVKGGEPTWLFIELEPRLVRTRGPAAATP